MDLRPPSPAQPPLPRLKKWPAATLGKGAAAGLFCAAVARKPNSVSSAEPRMDMRGFCRRRSFLWDTCCQVPQATYPRSLRDFRRDAWGFRHDPAYLVLLTVGFTLPP